MEDLEMQLLTPPPPPPPAADENDGGGSSSTRQLMQKVMLVIKASIIFTAPTVSSSQTIHHHHHHHQTTTIDIMEEADIDSPQTAPLLQTPNNSTSHSRRQMRRVFLVLHSVQIFKAHATKSKPTVAQTSHGLSSSRRQLRRSQSKKISDIVRDKDMATLREFGGLTGAAYALDTDLIKGLSDSEAINRGRLQRSTPGHKFSHWVVESLKNMTIWLLFVAAALSLVVGIQEEGLQNGWYDGVVVFITIFLILLLDSVRSYWQERRSIKKLHKQELQKWRPREVHVIREGEAKCISETKLVTGDVLLLKRGSHVPADGLFVDGQALELDHGSKSCTVNEQNPFLLHGERVINGDARMLVTGWSEMVSRATGDFGLDHQNFKFEAYLHNLNTCIHYTGLVISILIVLVLFFRFLAGKLDEENGYKLDSIAKPTATITYGNIFKKIVKESKNTARVLTKLLSVSLVGVTEGVPFVVSFAIFYWNHLALSDKATEQDSQAVIKMASVTRICTDTFGDFGKDETEVFRLFIGDEVVSGCSSLSPNVVEALCDGLSNLTENGVLDWAKEKFGFEREARTIRGSTQMCEDESVKELLKKCTHYYNCKGEKASMDDTVRSFFDHENDHMLRKQLRTLAIACEQEDELILVGLLGLKNKKREVTKAEVKALRDCGVETVIVTSEKVSVVEEIGRECGVFANDGSEPECLVISGEVFRGFTDQDRLEKVLKIRGLGEALPSDKLLLVQTLKKKGEVVAFLGQRSDEARSLQESNIGIAIGTWSSTNAIRTSNIIMRDAGYGDLITIVKSGRCIHQNIQRFLQLVLITTTSSTLISFWEIAAYGDASLTVVQLVWVNMAVDFLGGFGLLTQSSTDKAASLVPVSHGGSLVTTEMIRNIAFQVSYQVVWSVIVHRGGFGVMGTSEDMNTVVSNGFISCQFFNQFNARELRKRNFFKGVHRHIELWVAAVTFMVLHALLVMIQDFLGYAGTRIKWELWVGCVLVGVGSWVVDWFGKLISRFIGWLGDGCC